MRARVITKRVYIPMLWVLIGAIAALSLVYMQDKIRGNRNIENVMSNRSINFNSTPAEAEITWTWNEEARKIDQALATGWGISVSTVIWDRNNNGIPDFDITYTGGAIIPRADLIGYVMGVIARYTQRSTWVSDRWYLNYTNLLGEDVVLYQTTADARLCARLAADNNVKAFERCLSRTIYNESLY